MDVNLVMFKKSGVRKDISVPSDVITIGRKQDCDLCIPLVVVSRRHCQLSRAEDDVVIRDLGSTNGTYLNGSRIAKTDKVSVKPGDNLQIGPVTFTLQINGKPNEISEPPANPGPSVSGAGKNAVTGTGTFAGTAHLDDSQSPSMTELIDNFDDEIEGLEGLQ